MKTLTVLLGALALGCFSGCSGSEKKADKTGTEAILLGIAQDGGIPQSGCYCANCDKLQQHKYQGEYVASLGIVDYSERKFWLIDATPDFARQLDAMKKLTGSEFAGVILTHAHVGHYAGLINLGKEIMGAKNVPVYATQRLANYLSSNGPWSLLVQLNNINIQVITEGKEVKLSQNLTIKPFLVPHRDEFSDTIAVIVSGKNKNLFYCPDTDTWDSWKVNVKDFISSFDIALLDATFYTADELPHRDFTKIRHPLVKDSIEMFKDLKTGIIFIHLNHSNPLYKQHFEKQTMPRGYMKIGRFGDRWGL